MNAEHLLGSARDAYARIVASEHPSKELEKVVNEHPKGISQDEYQNLLSNCEGSGLIGEYVSSNLSMLARLNLDADVFYRRLWNVVSSNEVFAGEKEQIIALFFVLVSQALPYFKLSLTRMDTDEFKERQEDLGGAVDEVRHIVFRNYGQATEEASAIIDVVERQEDPKDRTVLVATYILMHGE